jgi:hypothetical protein
VSEDIVHRLRLFRNRRDAGRGYIAIEEGDRAMLSEAVAEIIELRGLVLQAENRTRSYREELEKIAKVKIIEEERTRAEAEARQNVPPKATRGRAIRIP